jgi:1,4-dihydroxy-6-naphthoate synthase
MALNITLGFSPCPNDTFMFAALINGWIDTHGINFSPRMADIETLNEWAESSLLDITKMSFNRYYGLEGKYQLLNSGAALGSGCGPILIAPKNLSTDAIKNSSIALPGVWTTAHLLFSIFYPEARNKQFMAFNKIEDAVLNSKADAGVIIHENRFTFEDRGLVKILDLGEAWEGKTNLPIPLGGIFASDGLSSGIIDQTEDLIKQSILYARANPKRVMPYVRQYSQEMDDVVMQNHIDLYVNDFSLDLGEKGKAAISHLKNMSL